MLMKGSYRPRQTAGVVHGAAKLRGACYEIGARYYFGVRKKIRTKYLGDLFAGEVRINVNLKYSATCDQICHSECKGLTSIT